MEEIFVGRRAAKDEDRKELQTHRPSLYSIFSSYLLLSTVLDNETSRWTQEEMVKGHLWLHTCHTITGCPEERASYYVDSNLKRRLIEPVSAMIQLSSFKECSSLNLLWKGCREILNFRILYSSAVAQGRRFFMKHFLPKEIRYLHLGSRQYSFVIIMFSKLDGF